MVTKTSNPLESRIYKTTEFFFLANESVIPCVGACRYPRYLRCSYIDVTSKPELRRASQYKKEKDARLCFRWRSSDWQDNGIFRDAMVLWNGARVLTPPARLSCVFVWNRARGEAKFRALPLLRPEVYIYRRVYTLRLVFSVLKTS